MVRYSFPVQLFHLQLHAGLSRRTLDPIGREAAADIEINLPIAESKRRF
jgi:hypothetical protein